MNVSSSAPPKSSLRFVCKLACVVLAVFAAGRLLGWFGARGQHVDRQRALLAEVEKLGGVAYYEHQLQPDGTLSSLDEVEDSWLAGLLGRDWAHDVFYVTFAEFRNAGQDGMVAYTKEDVTDEVLALAASTPSVRWLALNGTAVTDKGITNACRSLDLERLWIGQTQLTDVAIKRICQEPHLTHLSTEGVGITDAAMQSLLQAKSLEFLSLGSDRVSGPTLRGLGELSALRELHLDMMPVTDQSLAAFDELQELRVLSLRRTSVTDLGVRGIQLPKLERLHLDGTGVSGQAFRGHSGLGELRELSLTRSAIDDSSLAQLESLGKLRKLNVTGPNCSFGKLYALFHQQLGLEQADALEAFCQIQRDATRQVHTLDIGPVGFLDKDVEILASFPELRWLDLSDCELTDRGAEALAELDWPQLEVLNLNRTKITAAGALAAARIETLKNLHLAETGCNEVEVESLKKDRPKLSVYTVDLERAQRIVRSQDG